MDLKAIIRIKKIKTRTELKHRISHNLRIKDVTNANPEKSHNNIYKGLKSYDDVTRTLEERYTKYELKPRKDAIETFEVLLSASPGFFWDKSNEYIQDWINANFEFLKSRFPKNVLLVSVHLDETSPHIHAIVAPFTKDNRLSMKSYLGGRSALINLQDQYANAMKRFNLTRGLRNSKAKHQDIKKFYSKVNQATAQMEPELVLTQQDKEQLKLDKKLEELDRKLEKLQPSIKDEMKTNSSGRGSSKFKNTIKRS
mgnify:CR=1 FL=1|jgi:hypothetical protein